MIACDRCRRLPLTGTNRVTLSLDHANLPRAERIDLCTECYHLVRDLIWNHPNAPGTSSTVIAIRPPTDGTQQVPDR